MYLTSGAKVRTRRSRVARSLVRRYSFQSASVSSEERRRLEVCAVARLIRRCSLVRGGHKTYRDGTEPSASPVSGIRLGDVCPDTSSPLLGRGRVEPPSNTLKPVHRWRCA